MQEGKVLVWKGFKIAEERKSKGKGKRERYTQVAGYKINIQKSLAFLYTNNEKIEREIKETIPFTIAMKRIKYFGLYLPKETKDLYIENYKTLVKKSKRTLIDGEIYHVHGLEESI